MSELKPCPFCGESGSLYVEHMEGTTKRPAYRVYCDNCGASHRFTDRGDHIENWNRRAVPDQHPCCWAPSKALKELERGMNNAPCILTDGPTELNDTPLYRVPAGTIAAHQQERTRFDRG